MAVGRGDEARLDDFKMKYGVSGSVITAVPLIKGWRIGIGLGAVDVPAPPATITPTTAGRPRPP
jgi:2,3-bisphosphoglycerate-independent phosphoglycerate mutase